MAHFDFLVIGSGPAGQRGAIQAAKLGKRVTLVDRWPAVGGVSVHTGTIPSKTLREAILYLSGWRQRGFYGRDYRLKQGIGIADLMQRLKITIEHETAVVQDQLRRNGVEIVHGVASFAGSHQLRVQTADGKFTEYEAEKILIATGTRPRRPANVPFDDDIVLDSDSLLRMRRIPQTLAVIGGGVIGVEYASMFNALDVQVLLVHERPAILHFLDQDIASELLRHLQENGMVLVTGETVESIEREGDKVVTRLANDRRLSSDALLFSAGRIGCTTGLKLEHAGLSADERHYLKVNEYGQTTVPHIYAAGDVIGFPSLASTSMEQGRLAACHAFGREACTTPAFFPYGIYSVPEISMIGQTEQELAAQGIAYDVGRAKFRETARGQILGLQEGLLKMIFARDDGRLLGVHIVGEGATELIHIGQAVIALNGTLNYFLTSVFNYPTLAEAYKVAALDAWNRRQGR